jgi:adenylate cyclase, class 2
MATETEIKLAVDGVAKARRLLRAAGFHVSRGRIFEANTVFDRAGAPLRRAKTLLRLRQAGGKATLTYKGAPLPSRHKSREEVESEVGDPRDFAAILDRVGFHPVWRYEKYRTEYTLDRGPGTATLDDTPIGVYIELEGGARWIDRMARSMGFTPRDYNTKSYAQLYAEYCRTRGLKPGDMVF